MRRYETLKRRADFHRLRRSGRRVETSAFSLFSDRGRDGAAPLVGISVSGSVGGAVIRNLIKRRIGAAVQARLAAPAPGRLLVVAKPASATMSYAQLERALFEAIV